VIFARRRDDGDEVPATMLRRALPAAMRRATTPLGHDGPGLPAPQSYAGRRLPEVQRFSEALSRDADAAR
jgi:hypothetical protein